MTKIATCRSCHDPIVWAVTEAGNLGGNITLSGSTARVLSNEGQRLAAQNQQARYVSHFATCAHGGQWRSK